MKYFLLFFFVFFISINGFAKQAVEDVTIKAELSHTVQSIKPILDLKFDKTVVMQEVLDTEEEMLSLVPKNLVNVESALPRFIKSKQTILPYLKNIITAPVLRFRLKSKLDFIMTDWQIIVADSKGSLFFAISGQDDFSDLIEWNGVGDYGAMLIPGQWYSYNIDTIDEDGKKFTIQGETFNFKGLFYEQEGNKIISLALNALFDVASNASKIKKEGKLLLKEAIDLMKEYHDSPIRLIVYDTDKNIAMKRAKSIQSFINSNIITDDMSIEIEGVSSYVSENRVDIEIYL